MKKTVTYSTLIIVIFVLTLIPVLAADDNHQLPLDVTIYREQFADQLSEEETIASNGLPEETPFWVDMVNAEDLIEGEGVYIAVLDTGLLELWQFFFSEANIDFGKGIGFTHDIWWDSGIGDFMIGPLYVRDVITKPFEGSGHGTHVVSTIVGYRYSTATADFWVKGVAPKATIIPVLVLDAWEVPYPGGTEYFTGGTDEMVSAGINYVADLDLDGPVIISMSLGGETPSPMIEAAIDYAITKGVIVVASAGNEGYEGMGWPGAYPQVISCGMAGWTEQFLAKPEATRWWVSDVNEKLNSKDSWGNNWQIFLDEISSRPNKELGQKSFHLDVTTPGAAIVGPYKPYFSYDLGYYYLWGTSMAAPHVSGIAAQVLESHLDIDQRSMESILKKSAAGLPLPCDGSWVWDPWYDEYHFEWYGIDWGKGFLQADEALKTAK